MSFYRLSKVSTFRANWPAIGLAVACAAALALSSCATSQNNPNSAASAQAAQQSIQSQNPTQEYSENELSTAISTHLGVTSESAASAIERLFKNQGRPVGYITGEEGGGAFTIGARYGKGTLWMKDGRSMPVYWQGPTIGFDVGAEAGKVFTLVYGLENPEFLYRRFPGVDGSAYLVAGMAINVQRANGVTLAPVRAGVGLRLGANIGYTSYTRKRSIIPL
ncbi:MAG: EipA family protein [Litorimonas sp.]